MIKARIPASLVAWQAFAIFAAAFFFALGGMSVPRAHAASAIDTAVQLDPVPDIRFGDGYGYEWGFGCDSGCGYHHYGCYNGCGYRHYGCYNPCGYRRYGCNDGCYHVRCWHDCGRPSCWHDCVRGGIDLSREFLVRAARYDDQADRFDAMSDLYMHQAHEWDAKYGDGWHWHHDDGWHDGPPPFADDPPPGADGPPPGTPGPDGQP